MNKSRRKLGSEQPVGKRAALGAPNANDRFNDVVANAFDFLERSIAELQEGRPKYSVINFYSAVELFLKARLLKEHWSLIVMKPEKADKSEFAKGNFQSVGLAEAAIRLDKVVGDGLLMREIECFNKLRQYRNQMVHFAHASQWQDDEGEKERVRIASDHALGWHYLKPLLIERWKNHFQGYAERVGRLDKDMRNQAQYLGAKFEMCAPEIADGKKAGKHFVECPACHLAAYEVAPANAVCDGRCLVCGLEWTAVSFKCLDCDAPVYLVGDGYGHCDSCEKEYEPSDLSDVLGQSKLDRNLDPFDAGEIHSASCGLCEGYDTVLPLENDQWLCAECFALCGNEAVGACEWCSGPSTFLSEDSGWKGCSQCDGRAGWLRDKDD
jgi:hypothetical protein